MVYASIIIFLLTLAVTTYKNGGLPVCLSDCYYIIGKWFTLSMWAVAGTMTVPMIDQTPEPFEVLVFATVAGIMFVGAAGMYHEDTTSDVHKVAAVISAVCSILWVGIVDPWCLLCYLSALIGIADKRRALFWCEVACFASVYITLLL